MLKPAPLVPSLRKGVAVSLLLIVAACGGGGGNGSSNAPAVPLASTSTSSDSSLPANAAVDSYIQTQLLAQSIPGLALIVKQNDKIVYAKGYGYANLAQATPASTEQRFQIGSITKQFVAAAVMLLVEDGKMALDDPISKYLGSVPAAWAPITVRQILNHTSGLQQDIDDSVYTQADSHGAYSSDQMLAVMETYMPRTTPGASYSYSNLGYELMGVIIEKASGMFFGDLIQNRIFTPLGMSSARIIGFDNSAASATGYVMQNSKVTPLLMSSVTPGGQSWYRTGAGGIEMSASDMAKWDASLSSGQILKKSSLDQIWTPGPLVQVGEGYTIHYGLGWFLSDYNGHPKVYHSGGMPAFTSDYLRYTNDKLSVIVLTNLGTQWCDPETISRTVANMYVPGILPGQ
jgi:CubicO group peptidase (beta-lactamase class C family)